jgi:hypothetical protein
MNTLPHLGVSLRGQLQLLKFERTSGNLNEEV